MDFRARSRFIPTPAHIGLLLTVAALTIGGMEPAAGQTPPRRGGDGLARHHRARPGSIRPPRRRRSRPSGSSTRSTTRWSARCPGRRWAPSLAESWTESPDGLAYEFKLRRGLKFHNGDPVTAEDVKFSFERYKGAGAKELQARVRQVEIVDPLTVRFHLKEPWPDFMTFYGTTATAAGHRRAQEVPRPRSATTASASTRSAPGPTSS